MKRALVCGAGGFIGTHLVRQLKKEGYFVRGVDIKKPKFSKTTADEFLLLDLRDRNSCKKALNIKEGFDEVYQLAAKLGGTGYMVPNEVKIMHDNILINLNMINESVKSNVKTYFFASSTCVYGGTDTKSNMISENDVYPAKPDNEYGWEKLFSERLLLAYSRKYEIKVKIARFHTTYGPEGNYKGLQSKAVDALIRKAIYAKNDSSIKVWGDGKATRCFTYIDDLISGIRFLMQSDVSEPTNIGTNEPESVDNLAKYVVEASNKKLDITYIDGPVGVQAMNYSNSLILKTGWKPKWKLKNGVKMHYEWMKNVIKKNQETK